MRPLSAAEIKGNWATLLLPIQPDDAIDFGLLAEELDLFLAAQVDGIYSNGSAGEFYTQSEAEFDRINQLLAEKCNRAQLPFQIGASQMSPQVSLERIRRAKAWGPSAFQVIVPDWFPPQFGEIVTFLNTMGEAAAPVPLIVYNPPHAKRKLTPEEWGGICRDVPSVVGMKVAGGDEAWYRAMQPIIQRLSVFIPGHFLATGIAHGAHGAYSNVACLSPAGAQKWYGIIQSDPQRGLEIQGRIQKFFTEHILPLAAAGGYSNMGLDKCLAVIGGWGPITTRLRWPYRSVPMEQALALRPVARAAIPELF